jgi:alkanesulfonate monooxygenase SsuD/methylene tetrahydromethanopterin reductase-like flavin-dependent oxidoreductase (luciferase family)
VTGWTNKPYFHPLGILSLLAARTTTITLGELDHLSNGRFILGLAAVAPSVAARDLA